MTPSLKYFLSGFSIIALGAVLNGPVNAQTIEEAVKAAIENHPQVEGAAARVFAAEEEESAQFSGYFPEVSLDLSGGRIFGDNATTRGLNVTRGSAYSYTWEGNASLQQPLFDGFETLSRVRAAEAEKQSAAMTLQDVHEQIAYQTVQAYLNVTQSRVGLGMLRQQRKKVQDYLTRIESSVAQGGADEVELQQAKDVIVILDGFITDYDSQRKVAESQYFELTGHKPSADMRHSKINPGLLPSTLEDAFSYVEGTHPALKSAALLGESAKRNVEAEQGLLYPDVTGELSYLKSEKKEEIGGEVEDARALLRMRWNFETGGGQISRIRQKKHEYEEALAQEKQLKQQIQRDIEIAFAQRETAYARYENNKKRYALNKRLFETYNAQFEGGRVGLLQLMQADNQLFNTKLEAVIAQYRVLASEYGILASIGRLKNSITDMASADIKPADISANIKGVAEPALKEVSADDQTSE